MSFLVETWGEYACFTRPEMKTERVSYDVMTPSAARGILEAIYWHPGMRWIVDEIRVCNPIKFMNVRRNEVGAKISARNVKMFMTSRKGDLCMSAPKEIQQRASLILKDVRYVIKAHFLVEPRDISRDKAMSIFEKRLESGACYHEPCFGCREFHANFKRCVDIPKCPDELLGTRDLGFMLYDLDFRDSNNITPMFYRPVMRDGVIEVPFSSGEEVIL